MDFVDRRATWAGSRAVCGLNRRRGFLVMYKSFVDWQGKGHLFFLYILNAERKQMNYGIKRIIYLIIVVLIPLTAYLKWVFWEPSDITQNSFTYWLKVPAVAKQFPIWSANSEVLYDVRIADGVKPSFAIINYSSSNTLNQLMSNTKSLGFDCKVFENKDAVCDKNTNDEKSQQINITDTGGNRKVNVLLGGY
jgi:hypothetical protein